MFAGYDFSDVNGRACSPGRLTILSDGLALEGCQVTV